MNWLIDNWYIIVGLIALLLMVVSGIVNFFKLPTTEQISNVKEWLKWAVTQAEIALGGGTGQLKLRMVYDMAIQTFPWLAKCIKFETFSQWVDDALEWLNKQLDSNKNIALIVKDETI